MNGHWMGGASYERPPMAEANGVVVERIPGPFGKNDHPLRTMFEVQNPVQTDDTDYGS